MAIVISVGGTFFLVSLLLTSFYLKGYGLVRGLRLEIRRLEESLDETCGRTSPTSTRRRTAKVLAMRRSPPRSRLSSTPRRPAQTVMMEDLGGRSTTFVTTFGADTDETVAVERAGDESPVYNAIEPAFVLEERRTEARTEDGTGLDRFCSIDSVSEVEAHVLEDKRPPPPRRSNRIKHSVA